ncbi:MAG: polysaccharide deacetylase family protein [bacterium]
MKTDENVVILTFDDGPDPVNTPIVLDILDKYGIKAVFFIIGKNITGNEELTRQIVQRGHLIGTHSYSHSVMWDFQWGSQIRKDIAMTNALIEGITGEPPRYFRPPYGVINPMVHSGLRGCKLPVVAWSKRSFDTITRDKSRIIEKMTRNISPGDILLFHDTAEVTTKVLEKIILTLQAKDFRFASLDQFIKTNPHA